MIGIKALLAAVHSPSFNCSIGQLLFLQIKDRSIELWENWGYQNLGNLWFESKHFGQQFNRSSTDLACLPFEQFFFRSLTSVIIEND